MQMSVKHEKEVWQLVPLGWFWLWGPFTLLISTEMALK